MMNTKRKSLGVLLAGILFLGFVPGAMADAYQQTTVTVTLTEDGSCSVSNVAAINGTSFGSYSLSDTTDVLFTGPDDAAARTVTFNGSAGMLGNVSGAPVGDDSECDLEMYGTFLFHQGTQDKYGLYDPSNASVPSIYTTSGTASDGSPLYLGSSTGVIVSDGEFSVDLTLNKIVRANRTSYYPNGDITNPSSAQLEDMMGDYSSDITFTISPDI